MIIKSSEFVTSATAPSHYPPAALPEIAFAGRSNVGKSSLINKLLNRKQLVKISSTPGRTQLINFFLINKEYHFVDLPGYGYAKVPVPIRREWGPMIETYLSTRSTLKGVVLIIDIRRVPGTEERNLIDWLNHFNIPIVPVLTKSDKISKTNQIKQQASIANFFSIDKNDLTIFSSKSGQGRDTVLSHVENLINSKLF